ncbi:protein transport protein Sec61 subunit beta-like [Dendronephthya gigantea]|uniref:protein transport protein Sec61 subunit beta-like n=1 Tax=Dendronephthya gigantea TaxID=151771 RepID=UPI00106B21FA|nr:protein transport protein Sec61 subunit beta-like [Dendronephthya gigantea]
MVQSASATSVGGGSKSPSKGLAKTSSGGGQARQRKGASSAVTRRTAPAGGGGMWKFYTEDSPGLKVGPVPVLVLSLLFIASVFLLHIWGKYNRS